MATFVKGNAVPNASGYELLEKVGESYNSLATASEINFEVSAMDFAAGDHLLAVKAKGDGVNYSDSDPSETVTYTVEEQSSESVVFDFDFATNNIDDYALSDIFTVPEGSDTASIEYDSTYGMSLNNNLPNGLNLVNPIDASKAWTLEFTALFVTPTVLEGNRRAFLGGNDLYPFVFINGGTFGTLGFQVSNGSHAFVGSGKLVYDQEAEYKVVYDGAGTMTIYANGEVIGTTTINMTGNFTVILGNVSGKSSAYVWKNVEDGKKSYLHKMKFYYN